MPLALWLWLQQSSRIMFVPDKLKLNKYKEVKIPSMRSYFGRFGLMEPNPSQYTGEVAIPIAENKVDSLSRIEREYMENTGGFDPNDK